MIKLIIDLTMKLFGLTFKYLTVLMIVILLSNVKLMDMEESFQNTDLETSKAQVVTTELEREMTKEEQRIYDSVKKPNASKEIPEDVRFMQREMAKAYKAAVNQNPRFRQAAKKNKKVQKSHFTPDKGVEGQPINRDG